MSMAAMPASTDAVLPRAARQREAHALARRFIWFKTGGAAEWLVRPADRRRSRRRSCARSTGRGAGDGARASART